MPYPHEFRGDVVHIAANRDPGVPLRQIAAGFGISETCLQNWVRQAAVETSGKPDVTKAEAEETRELRKRVRLLEQENEVRRRAASFFVQAHLPGNVLPARDRARR
ncbi:transposase [Microbacterium azadirachtae]|nr:transposase [Microbacterium azadirachtae]